MKHIVIACYSNAITRALANALKSKYIVHTCKTRDELAILLETYRPSILIINLFLHGSDGITALTDCKYTPQTILALTYTISQSIIDDARNVGIQDLLVLPCSIQHILDRLDLLIQQSSFIH